MSDRDIPASNSVATANPSVDSTDSEQLSDNTDTNVWDIPIPGTTPTVWWNPWHTWENNHTTSVDGDIQYRPTTYPRVNRPYDASQGPYTTGTLDITAVGITDTEPNYWFDATNSHAIELAATVAWANNEVLVAWLWGELRTLIIPVPHLNTTVITEALTRAARTGVLHMPGPQPQRPT